MMREITSWPVSDLKLDPENPRLPEDVDTTSQATILERFYKDYALDELAASYVVNGFFPSEHLLILEDGTVLEGNRRLAALKFLLHDKDAIAAEIGEYDSDEPFSDEDKEQLRKVPVLVVEDRDDVWAYLGYRHISGTKEWSPAAKARFISRRVDKAAQDDPDDCFKMVGKEVGSNARGACNNYIHYGILRAARDEYGLYREASQILSERFGVWSRLLNSSAVFDYIGFSPKSKTYREINDAFENLDEKNLRLLMKDMTPDAAGRRLLHDSRQATPYATILQNPEALKLLRETGDFDSALMVAQGSPISVRLQKVETLVSMINRDLDNGVPIESDSLALVEKLSRILAGIKLKVELALNEESTMQGDADDEN